MEAVIGVAILLSVIVVGFFVKRSIQGSPDFNGNEWIVNDIEESNEKSGYQ